MKVSSKNTKKWARLTTRCSNKPKTSKTLCSWRLHRSLKMKASLTTKCRLTMYSYCHNRKVHWVSLSLSEVTARLWKHCKNCSIKTKSKADGRLRTISWPSTTPIHNETVPNTLQSINYPRRHNKMLMWFPWTTAKPELKIDWLGFKTYLNQMIWTNKNCSWLQITSLQSTQAWSMDQRNSSHSTKKVWLNLCSRDCSN